MTAIIPARSAKDCGLSSPTISKKYQPASPLSHWYIQRTAGQSSRIRRIMLIALARKLAISLWHYVETGLVPEGVAIAKAKLRPA